MTSGDRPRQHTDHQYVDQEPVVLCEGVTHGYRDDEGTRVDALVDIELRVRPGETVALVGPSGAGKSTLLSLLAGLVRPTSGSIRVAGREVTALSERALLRLRAHRIGMVLQTPGRNLLPYGTAHENVAFAQHPGGWSRSSRSTRRADREAEVADLLASVGLVGAASRPARLLSGGQQQRLALAVALAGRPAVLLADEPTSQLDQTTGEGITQLLIDARDRYGTAMLVVTHDHHVSDRLDTIYSIDDGRLTRASAPPEHPSTGAAR